MKAKEPIRFVPNQIGKLKHPFNQTRGINNTEKPIYNFDHVKPLTLKESDVLTNKDIYNPDDYDTSMVDPDHLSRIRKGLHSINASANHANRLNRIRYEVIPHPKWKYHDIDERQPHIFTTPLQVNQFQPIPKTVKSPFSIVSTVETLPVKKLMPQLVSTPTSINDIMKNISIKSTPDTIRVKHTLIKNN